MAVSPIGTFNTLGNGLASASIAASATRTVDFDASGKFEIQVQTAITFGTVAATSGLQLDFFRQVSGGTVNDSIATFTYVIPSTTSTTKTYTIPLPWGKWHMLLTNLDGTNGLTVSTVTTATLDSVG